MKITRRRLRQIIKESINEVRMDIGSDIDFQDFYKMARHFGKEIHTVRTSRDGGHDEIRASLPKGDFTMRHIYNMSLGSFFVRYSFIPRDGSKAIKDEPVSSEREMYEIVQSYLNLREPGGKLVPIPSGLRGKASGTGIIER